MVAFDICHSLAYWKLLFALEYMLAAIRNAFPLIPTRGESAKRLFVPRSLALKAKRHCPVSPATLYLVTQPTIRDSCVFGLKARAMVMNRSNISGGCPGN